MIHSSPASLFALFQDRLYQYWLLTRFHRPIGILLLLWPALWAVWVAGEGKPTAAIVAVLVLGTLSMRGAGCAINDYADRDFDPHVQRTRDRPIAAGRVSPREALGVFVALVLISLGLVLTLNIFTVQLSVIGAMLAASYPFTKRYTHLPQFYLGLAFGWAVPMAFAAQTSTVSSVGWLLFAATAIWAVVYDTQYAMVDREDDLKIGVKSTAILFGQYDRLAIGLAQVGVIGLLVIVGKHVGLSFIYYLGLAGAIGLFIYQQWLIRNREPAKCFQAFLNNNWFGMVVFIAIALDYVVRSYER